MAAKKSAKKRAVQISTAAFQHAAGARGAQYLDGGFGFDPQEDLEWALGWPHVRRLVDGHPDDKNPVKGWEKLCQPFPKFRMDFPREVAARQVRVFKWAPATGNDAFKWMANIKKHLETAGPITDKEAREIIRLQLANDKDIWWLDNFPQTMLLMEAFVGPVPVAEALVESLEAVPVAMLNQSGPNRFQCYLILGFLFLRLPIKVSTALQARVRKVLDDVVATLPKGLVRRDPDKEQDYLPYRALDLALNGREGALRSGDTPTLGLFSHDLVFVQGDRKFVLDQMRRLEPEGPDETEPLARVVFLGSEDVLDVEAKWWSKYTEPNRDDAQRNFVRDYGRIRSEKILPIFLAMSTRSKANKEAAEWFAAHADYARLFLEKASQGKAASGKTAKALLR